KTTIMAKSSLPAPNPHNPANSPKHFQGDVIDQQWLAESLTAALSGGDLDKLGQARQTFSDHALDDRDLDFPDLARLLERRSAPRSAAVPVPVSDDRLREQEEELLRAEEQLKRRRREVENAKRHAEEEAKRQAIEAQRRAIEVEAQRRARENAERLAELE